MPHTIPRPDECYREAFRLASLANRSRIQNAEFASSVGFCGSYVIHHAAELAAAEDGQTILFANRAEVLNQLPASVAELLSGQDTEVASNAVAAGLLDQGWIWELLRRLIASSASDPAMMDRVATWVAPYLST